METLNKIREEIDKIDEQIVELFGQRMTLSANVVEEKQKQNLPVLNKGREREVLSRVRRLAPPELETYTQILYTTLFDLSKSYQIKLSNPQSELAERINAAVAAAPQLFPSKGLVACQGVEGAYSQMAADKLFKMPEIMYFSSFAGVFQAVQSGLCDYGILPIENSCYGSVNGVYDLMRDYQFHIVRSIKLHIDHNLLVKPGTQLKDIKEIYSHEQAIGQCSKFLDSLPNVEVHVVENTALAAQMVAESERNDIAAISSHNCAELYSLSALPVVVQNSDNNYTRFICITKELVIYPGASHISLMFSVPHKPGSLYNIISQFAALGINLSKLESRPAAGSDFEFVFYIDIEGSVWSEDVVQLLGELAKTNELFVFLGCYTEI